MNFNMTDFSLQLGKNLEKLQQGANAAPAATVSPIGAAVAAADPALADEQAKVSKDEEQLRKLGRASTAAALKNLNRLGGTF